jgi:hypothetical protein
VVENMKLILQQKVGAANTFQCICPDFFIRRCFATAPFGPSDWNRTSGLLNPIQARYQSAPHPDITIMNFPDSTPCGLSRGRLIFVVLFQLREELYHNTPIKARGK